MGLLLSCAQAPDQVAENTLEHITDLVEKSTVRLVNQVGTSTTLGTGFFVEKDKIVTNIHVVGNSGTVFAIQTGKEKVLTVEGIVGFDANNNLVILKVSGKGTPLPIGDSDAVQIGETFTVVGYPNQIYRTTTATLDTILISQKWFWMEIDITYGYSGGPVLNSQGQVIAAAVRYSKDSQSYAIPSNRIKELLTKPIPLEPLVEWQKRNVIRAEVIFSIGEKKYFAEDYKQALVDYNEAIELNSEHVRAYYKRGNVNYKLEKYTASIDDYTKAIKLNPKHVNAYNNLAGVKFKLGESIFEKGDTEKARNLYQEAIEDCSQAIYIDPEDASAYSNRGITRFTLGDIILDDGNAEKAQHLYQEAIEDCSKAIKIFPNKADYYYNRGIAKCKLGDTESAHGNLHSVQKLHHEGITDYDKSIELKNSTDIDTDTTNLEHEKGRASTVRVMGWSDGFSKGSGFFIDTDKIATNIHVTAGVGPIYARLSGTDTLRKVIGSVGYDVENDLVIFQIEGNGIPLTLGDSAAVKFGEPVVTIGYPHGKFKVTHGTLYGLRKNDRFLQTTANTAPGSSGGPILNNKNQVIGIHVQHDKTYSYAIPVNYLKTILDRREPMEQLLHWQNRDNVSAYAYYDTGEDYINTQEFHKAIVNFDKAIKLNPEFTRAYFKRAYAKNAIEDFSGSIDDYTQVIHLNPIYISAYNNRALVKYISGKCKSEKGDVTEAQVLLEAGIEDSTKAILLDPEDADHYNNRGVIKYTLAKSMAEQGNESEAQVLYLAAIEDYTRTITIDPEYIIAYNNRGKAKEALGKQKEAEKDYAKAKEMETNK